MFATDCFQCPVCGKYQVAVDAQVTVYIDRTEDQIELGEVYYDLKYPAACSYCGEAGPLSSFLSPTED